MLIVETRPISARKHFRLLKVTEKAGVQHVEAEPAKADIIAETAEAKAEKPKAEKEEQA